jgi:hypothetical protein
MQATLPDSVLCARQRQEYARHSLCRAHFARAHGKGHSTHFYPAKNFAVRLGKRQRTTQFIAASQPQPASHLPSTHTPQRARHVVSLADSEQDRMLPVRCGSVCLRPAAAACSVTEEARRDEGPHQDGTTTPRMEWGLVDGLTPRVWRNFKI